MFVGVLLIVVDFLVHLPVKVGNLFIFSHFCGGVQLQRFGLYEPFMTPTRWSSERGQKKGVI